MSGCLADSMQQSAPLKLSGGSCHDIAQLVFASQALKAIKKRTHEYVTAMRLVGKEPSCVRLSVGDYSKLIAAVAKAHGIKASEVSGLRHDGIPVVSG